MTRLAALKPDRGSLRALALGTIILTAALVGGVSQVSAQDSVDEPAVIADVQETGTVDLTIVFTYDLETTTEAEAFDQLQTDDALAAEMESRFSDRMAQVANATAIRTGRDIALTDVELAFDSNGSTGIVALTATISDLASVQDGEIALSHPFSAEFETDRPVIVTVPDGYEITSVSPTPDERDTSTVRWAPDRSLEGFSVIAIETTAQSGTTQTGTAEPGTTTASAPGMGIVAGLIALSGAVALRRRG